MWLYAKQMDGGTPGQMEAVCETAADLTAAEGGDDVVCGGRSVRMDPGSVAFCLADWSPAVLGSDLSWKRKGASE